MYTLHRRDVDNRPRLLWSFGHIEVGISCATPWHVTPPGIGPWYSPPSPPPPLSLCQSIFPCLVGSGESILVYSSSKRIVTCTSTHTRGFVLMYWYSRHFGNLVKTQHNVIVKALLALYSCKESNIAASYVYKKDVREVWRPLKSLDRSFYTYGLYHTK